jgi:hypothetical protein
LFDTKSDLRKVTPDEKFCLWVVIFLAIVFLYVFFSSSRTPTKEELSHPVLSRIRENFARIDPRFANIPVVLSTHGAYTEDKRYIAMCVKDPRTGRDYDFNEIMYVSLHELAHYTSRTYGHNAEFMKNFRQLLSRAQSLGIYYPLEPPETFCE